MPGKPLELVLSQALNTLFVEGRNVFANSTNLQLLLSQRNYPAIESLLHAELGKQYSAYTKTKNEALFKNLYFLLFSYNLSSILLYTSINATDKPSESSVLDPVISGPFILAPVINQLTEIKKNNNEKISSELIDELISALRHTESFSKNAQYLLLIAHYIIDYFGYHQDTPFYFKDLKNLDEIIKGLSFAEKYIQLYLNTPNLHFQEQLYNWMQSLTSQYVSVKVSEMRFQVIKNGGATWDGAFEGYKNTNSPNENTPAYFFQILFLQLNRHVVSGKTNDANYYGNAVATYLPQARVTYFINWLVRLFQLTLYGNKNAIPQQYEVSEEMAQFLLDDQRFRRLTLAEYNMMSRFFSLIINPKIPCPKVGQVFQKVMENFYNIINFDEPSSYQPRDMNFYATLLALNLPKNFENQLNRDIIKNVLATTPWKKNAFFNSLFFIHVAEKNTQFKFDIAVQKAPLSNVLINSFYTIYKNYIFPVLLGLCLYVPLWITLKLFNPSIPDFFQPSIKAPFIVFSLFIMIAANTTYLFYNFYKNAPNVRANQFGSILQKYTDQVLKTFPGNMNINNEDIDVSYDGPIAIGRDIDPLAYVKYLTFTVSQTVVTKPLTALFTDPTIYFSFDIPCERIGIVQANAPTAQPRPAHAAQAR